MRRGIRLFCIVAMLVVFQLFAASFVTAQTVWLDELDLSAANQGYGLPMKNKSIDGRTLTIAGQTYSRGFGTHAISSLIILLDGNAISFSAKVGVDDEVKGHNASIEFELYGDGKKLWSSGIMRVGIAAKTLEVSLDGVQKLELVVTDGGDGNSYDHANWVDAKFEAKGVTSFQAYTPVSSERYILTPKPSSKPRLTGAKVFGVRPNSPFQHLLTATGDRPMTFSAVGLPEGLQINVETGLITGVLLEQGTYIVTLSAKNAKGKAERQFRIECGEQIALTPPMGWNSWNCFAHEVSADKVKRAANAMVNSGLINHGWTYINIDDFWENHRDSNDPSLQGKLRDENGYIIPNKRFGDMKALADYVHDLGLKIGLYSSPGPWTCGGSAGSYGYEKQDAESYANWGFDYLKYDWCSYGNVIDGLPNNDPYSVSSLSYNGGGVLETAMRPFQVMGEYLKEQPRDIVYSLCQYGMSDVWKWGSSVGGHAWRTTNDITDTWNSVKDIALDQDRSAPYAKPGNWNDPDMLVVGHVGWGNPKPSKLKPDEQYLHISLWSLFAAPLLIGCDMEQLDDFTLNLLTNDEVIEVNQDPLGIQATCQQTIGELRIYVKELEDGSRAVGFCNFGLDAVDIAYSDFNQIGLNGKFVVRDLWRQRNIATVNTQTDKLNIRIPAHGVLFYKFIDEELAYDPNFHIYLCFGQSNMEGASPITDVDHLNVNDRFKVMTVSLGDSMQNGRVAGKWYTATPPLCRWDTGLSPADYFGRTLVDSLPDSITVGVILVAMGGSGIDAFDKENYAQYYQNADAWQKGLMNIYAGNPYAKMIEMAKLAQKRGDIKGILLHQGETNNGQSDWPQKVKKIYYDMLDDLGVEVNSIPLLAGEMLHQDQGGICWGMNSIIAKLPDYIPNSHVISADGCEGIDDFHFSNAGQRELGQRYGLKMLSLWESTMSEMHTVDSLMLGDKDFTLLTGTSKKVPLTAIFRNGHIQDVSYLANYTIENPNVVEIENGIIKTLDDGESEVKAIFQGKIGDANEVVFVVRASTFPLVNSLFNPGIWENGTFDETTKTLKTGPWGFGGWQYNGIDLSDYKYIVAKLGSENNADVTFNIYDENNYWSSPASYKFGSNKQIVAVLNQSKKSDNSILNPKQIYIAGFWSNGNSPFVIDTVFLSNSSEYDPPSIIVMNEDGYEVTDLTGFYYEQGFGPSDCQTLVVSGSLLTNSLTISMPAGFEVSLDSTLSFASKITLNQNNGNVSETIVYVRMKGGLTKSPNAGNITIVSQGAFTRTVILSGSVGYKTGTEKLSNTKATILSTHYYSITGQKVSNINNLKGLFIVKKLMSDGTVQAEKVFLTE